ncbi:MAG: queuosine precursor transporter [Hyphomicrobiales bacterium]
MQDRNFIFLATSMVAVVLVSNILVQYPVQLLGLQDVLTWAAFTYPIAFFVTDLTNRYYGLQTAKRVVYVGFTIAVVLSILFATPRIAIASGTAFLASQIMDIYIFRRYIRHTWWKAPIISSALGSLLDTTIFFSIAFSLNFSFLGYGDSFATEKIPVLLIEIETSRWIMWAIGDLIVKLLVALALLIPFRIFYISNYKSV